MLPDIVMLSYPLDHPMSLSYKKNDMVYSQSLLDAKRALTDDPKDITGLFERLSRVIMTNGWLAAGNQSMAEIEFKELYKSNLGSPFHSVMLIQ